MRIKIQEVDEANTVIDIKIERKDHQSDELRKIKLCHNKISFYAKVETSVYFSVNTDWPLGP